MRLSVWLARSFRASSFLVLALVLSFSQRLLAQQYVVANASIPFDFVAGPTAFAAGDYIIDSSVPSFIVIRSKDASTPQKSQLSSTTSRSRKVTRDLSL